jgi:hypothetical protein
MPVDLLKKRERDARYRAKQRLNNPEYATARRAITKKSSARRAEQMTSREKRNQKRQRTKAQRDYRARKKAALSPLCENESATTSSPRCTTFSPNTPRITPKRLAALRREKRKVEKQLVLLKNKNVKLSRQLWREKKRGSRAKVSAYNVIHHTRSYRKSNNIIVIIFLLLAMEYPGSAVVK